MVAVVTGASRGIGAEIALALSSAGARVALTARSEAALQRQARKLPTDTLVVPADLRSPESVTELARIVTRKWGAPHILVNAAGVWHEGDEKFHGPLFAETPPQQIEQVVGVGLGGAMRVTRAFLPAMTRQRKGHVIQIGCGFSGPAEARGWVHYYVSNLALAAFTRGLAEELRPARIQVNCVAPWYVATKHVKRLYKDEAATALQPKRVAECVLDLVCGPLSRDVSGQVIELRSSLDV